ncbi:MAG: hypothetical protein SLAVMIC_00617 [uncultured marine phage]|uniref:Uncharacterized protein n=1 Tax=uncultured marine phage TaxID=707152 RepID=A0A8D9CCF0_9VIRU|nr:MAG: hypothetical protein SLAVMIC_00617 [uncultured marine phage]
MEDWEEFNLNIEIDGEFVPTLVLIKKMSESYMYTIPEYNAHGYTKDEDGIFIGVQRSVDSWYKYQEIKRKREEKK